jgi:hypothetical protein
MEQSTEMYGVSLDEWEGIDSRLGSVHFSVRETIDNEFVHAFELHLASDEGSCYVGTYRSFRQAQNWAETVTEILIEARNP